MRNFGSVIADRLRERRPEIEEAILARVHALPDPIGGRDAEYLAGRRATITAVVDYGIARIEQGEEWSEPTPPVVLAQARRAARLGVRYDTVVRRCVAGHALLEDYVMEEAERADLLGEGAALRSIRRVQASLLERLLASLADEYAREAQRPLSSHERRRVGRVRRLLAGEQLDAADLGYEFHAHWHLGMIATGAEATRALRGLIAQLGRSSLQVAMGESTVWAWLGGPRKLGFSDITRALSASEFAEASLAIGEPGRGIEGFRLTHRQAQTALSVALCRPQRLTRYADVALIAPWLQDEGLARSLVELYLSPLDQVREGSVLRETLRQYFAAGRNAKAAAAALGVDRGTVAKRLRTIEQLVGEPLYRHLAELEVAMRLDELHKAQQHGVGERTSE